MNNSMRWGLMGLTATGLLMVGAAFGGCSSSDDPTPAADTGTPDTAVTETAPDTAVTETTPDAADATDGEVDAPVAAAPRKITIVHASPDAGKQLFCFGAGAGGSLAKALLIGAPNAADPTNLAKYEGFPYGTVLPLTFPNALVASDLIAGLEKLTIYVWPIGATNPIAGTADAGAADAETACNNAWTGVKGDPTKFIEVPAKTVLGGTSIVLYATGCATPGSKLECGGAAPQAMKLGYHKLDLTSPFATGGDAGTDASETGTGGKQVAVHYLHASAFPGVAGAVPSFQGVDVYLLPMTAAVAGDGGADTGTASSPAGAPVKVATNIKYGDWVDPSAAFTLPAAADENSTLMILMPTGVTFCAPGSSATCAAVPIPASYFLPTYKAAAAGGGLPTPGFVDGTDQLFVLAGSPTDTNPATTTLRWGFGNVTKP